MSKKSPDVLLVQRCWDMSSSAGGWDGAWSSAGCDKSFDVGVRWSVFGFLVKDECDAVATGS